MNLKGKTVLITGGAKRIGRSLALAFARQGARILIHYHRSKSEAEKLLDELSFSSPESRVYWADLSRFFEIGKMSKRILKDVGCVDVLVNSASVFFSSRFEKTTEKEWNLLVDTNLKSVFFLSQALAPAMKKKGEGRIINIADIWGLKPQGNYLAYSLTKAGLIALTEGLAKELSPEVLVTSVCPGLILPPPGLTQKQKERLAQGPLLGRWGKPEDVSRLVVFLAGSDFMTGSHHLVDGGEFLGR